MDSNGYRDVVNESVCDAVNQKDMLLTKKFKHRHKHKHKPWNKQKT